MLFLLLFLFLGVFVVGTWKMATLLVAAYILLIWVQALCCFLFEENLMGNQPEIMLMTGHLWNQRGPRNAFWVAVVGEEEEEEKEERNGEKGEETNVNKEGKLELVEETEEQSKMNEEKQEQSGEEEEEEDERRGQRIVGAIAILETPKNKNKV